MISGINLVENKERRLKKFMPAKEEIRENPIKLNRLKGYRVETGKIPDEIAKKMKIGRNTYYAKERGSSIFSISEFLNLVSILDLDLEKILDLFTNEVLNTKLKEYKNKVVNEVQKQDKEYFSKLVEGTKIEVGELPFF